MHRTGWIKSLFWDERGGEVLEYAIVSGLIVVAAVGVIGKIGTILGEHGVNIANFALGRDRSGVQPVKALAVVQVDAPVGQDVLNALMQIEALLEARLVTLPEAKS